MLEITTQQIEKIDEFLPTLLKSYKKNASAIFSPSDISSQLNIDLGEAKHLINILIYIEFEGNKIVEKFRDSYLQANYNTERFLDAGGAVEWYNKQLTKQKKEERRQELEQINLEIAIKEFKLSQEEYKRTRKESRYFKWAAIISAVVAVGSLILQILGTL